MKKPFVCVITGASGAGKTTVSSLLARKYKKCAVIEVDTLRHFIKSGFVDPFNKKDGHSQLVLGTKNACLLAKSFLANGFNVLVDDYIGGKERSMIYKKSFRKNKFFVVALLPSREVAIKRDTQRKGTARMGVKRIAYLHDKITQRSIEEQNWILVDNSKHKPEKTAAEIFRHLK